MAQQNAKPHHYFKPWAALEKVPSRPREGLAHQQQVTMEEAERHLALHSHWNEIATTLAIIQQRHFENLE